ncbi:MAG: protein phosphatase 2C domain-containing protein [Clostridiales bacterium]|nr:protein phosphatase 2C domain-containing protein [Clostridiales bacterium]MBR5937708.1 protein phosphatase 2C domain-containing protein [Clostridiales bacterium]
MREKPVLVNTSLIGNKHLNRGTPCEDASCTLSRNGVSVVCVSDGAGGAKYTHARFGSKCAVDTIANLLCDHFDAFYFENRESISRSLLVTAVHSSMADLLVEHQLDGLERLSCTLLFVAVKGDLVLAGHIGDGMICRISSSGISPLTLPANGENASSTYFITFPNAQEYLRFLRTTTDDTHAFVLMTDGVEEMVYDSSTQLIRPVVARLAELAAKGKEEAEKELSQTIQEFVIGAGQNTDDASVGILYLPDTKVPDFSAINDSKDRFDRNHEDTIRSVQMEWVPKVKHAQEILSAISAGKPVENICKAAVSEDEPSEKKQAGEETVKVSQGDNSKKEEGEEKTTLPSEEKSGKTVPLWLFLLMSGAFIATAVGLILQLI